MFNFFCDDHFVFLFWLHTFLLPKTEWYGAFLAFVTVYVWLEQGTIPNATRLDCVFTSKHTWRDETHGNDWGCYSMSLKVFGVN